jgi:hypothetical protein
MQPVESPNAMQQLSFAVPQRLRPMPIFTEDEEMDMLQEASAMSRARMEAEGRHTLAARGPVAEQYLNEALAEIRFRHRL